MNIQEIINEADILVPNAVDTALKIVWLNAVNQDFFNVVKIPRLKKVSVTSGTDNYSVGSEVLEKNVFRVRFGNFFYSSLNYNQDAVNNTGYTLDDDSDTITLNPAPYANGVLLIHYFKAASSNFTSSDLGSNPDAPLEYHWTYIVALAAYLAKTEDDAIKAGNYESEYKNAWNVAAQNYQVGEQS